MVNNTPVLTMYANTPKEMQGEILVFLKRRLAIISKALDNSQVKDVRRTELTILCTHYDEIIWWLDNAEIRPKPPA